MRSKINRYDYCIVGGGPAGSAAAARLAGAGRSVILIERSDFSRFRIGETIDAALRPLLARIGVDSSAVDVCSAPCSAVGACWGSPAQQMRPSLFNPFGAGWRVDRAHFDMLLFEQAAIKGAHCIQLAQCRPSNRSRGIWTIVVQAPGGEFVIEARWVIEATGRSATSRFAPNNQRHFGDQLFAATFLCQASSVPTDSKDCATVIEAAPAGWWYSLILPRGGSLCAFFTDRDLLPRGKSAVNSFLGEQLEFAPSARSHMRGARNRNLVARFFDARTSVRCTLLTAGWLAIGDAMLALDPLSGNGVVRAMENALDVCDWLEQTDGELGNHPPQWSLRQQELLLKYTVERRRIYSAERRWANSPFWLRRGSASDNEKSSESKGTH